MPAQSQTPPPIPEDGFVWQAEMPLLTNRFFLYDMAKLLFWTGLIGGILFATIALLAGGPEAVPKLLAIFGLILGGFGFLLALIALVFFGNAFPMLFFAGPAGLGWETRSRRAVHANRAAALVGAIAGSPGTAGAGLIADAGESGLPPWSGVSRIKAYPALRVLSVMNRWRVVVRLYCTPENFPRVLELARRYAPGALVVAPAPFRGVGRPPAPALEFLRRAALAGGAAASMWFAFDSPDLLIHVRRADFAAEYERRYGERGTPVWGAMEMAREFLRRHARPPSLAAFIAQTTEGRVVEARGGEWDRLYASTGPGGRWFRPEDEPVARILPEIRRVYGRASWLVMYLPVEGGHLEIEYVNRPRESKAPAGLIYPNRAACWLWLPAGVAIYCLLPWPRSSPRMLLYDGAVSGGLDLLGTVVGAFFLALPVYAAHSTAEALGEGLALTLLLWGIGCIGLSILLWSAARASFHVCLEPHQVRIGGLAGSRSLPAGEISAVEYMMRGETPTGIELSARRGVRERIGWDGLPHVEELLDLLRRWGHAPRLRVS